MSIARARLDIWSGVECIVNRVADRWLDRLWSGRDRRGDDLERFASR